MEAILSGGNIILAILGFAFVIFIHELGHFVFAKWAGVRVDVFSIGFGPTVWSKTIGETNYRISILPLGGYVRMLGQEDIPGQEVEASKDPASFANKHPGWRTAILFGGVLFNLISSWLILVALAFYGMPTFSAQVGAINPTITTLDEAGNRQQVPSPAVVMGLQQDDVIIGINDESIRDYEDVIFATLSAGVDPVTVRVRRDGEEITLPEVEPVYSIDAGKVVLGMQMRSGRNIGSTAYFGAGEGLPTGATITGVNGETVDGLSGQALESKLLPSIGKTVEFSFADGSRSSVRWAGTSLDLAGRFGLPVRVSRFTDDSAARDAGMQLGDLIVGMNNIAIQGTEHLRSIVHQHAASGPLQVQLLRRTNDGWGHTSVAMTPRFDAINQRYLIGIQMAASTAGLMPSELPQALGDLPGPFAQWMGNRDESVVLLGQPEATQGQYKQWVLSNARTSLLPLDDPSWERMDHFTTVGPVSRLVGMRGQAAVSSLLHGMKVDAVNSPQPGWITVSAPVIEGEAVVNRIDLNELPAVAKQTLLGLQPGTWIADTAARNEAGIRCLEISTATAIPQRLILSSAAVGAIVQFGIEEQTYELQHWTEAFSIANHKTVQMIGKTLQLIPNFFKSGTEGGLDASKSLHGPIGIFSELKARSEHLGFASYLKIVALIGLNLFLVNLLPIPITDGGQLVFLGIEVAIRRPVPAIVVNIANYIGFILIVGLMLYVIGLDIARQVFS